MSSKLFSNQRLRRALPYLGLAVAWALFFWRFAAPDLANRLTYAAGDFSQQFGVFRGVAYHALTTGQLPLWVDCLYSGYPFHADPQSQLFYPPIWLIMAFLRVQGWAHFPLEALVLEVVLHYLLASYFMYGFLRFLRLRPAAAVLGALVFTYSGYLTGSPPLQTGILETVVWLPLALLCAGRLAERRRTRDLAALALVLAVAFLAGHPQTFLYCAGLTLVFFALRAWQAGWGLRRLAVYLPVLLVLTLGLTAVQLLPSAHFIANSTRATVSFEQAGHGFPFADVLQFFITNLVSYWNPLYVGLLPLGLAVFALTRRSVEVWFWAIVALLALLLSFGTKAIAYDVAYWLVPGYQLFRSQERLALAVSLALAILAAYGADALLSPTTPGQPRAVGRLIVAGGALFGGAWLLLVGLVYARQLSLPVTSELVERAGLFVLASGLALLALGLAARRPGAAWLPALFAAVVIIDLFAANRATNVVAPYAFYPFNPLLEAVYTDDAFFRVQDDAQLAGHAGCAYGYRAIEGVAPYQVASYTHFIEHAPEPVRWHLLGVRYVVSWRAELGDAALEFQPVEATARGDVPDDKGNVTVVHRLGGPPQRAFIVYQSETADSDAAVFDRLAAPDFDPLATVVLRAPGPLLAGPAAAAGPPVTVVADAPGQITLHTDSRAPGILVVSEAYFPGWQATIDGAAAPVLAADGALLGVALPAGAHTVAFWYFPPVLLVGSLLSAVALALTGGLLVSRRQLPGFGRVGA